MYKNRFISIILAFLLIFCGESSTQENVGSVALSETQEINQKSENQQENNNIEKTQGENPPNNNQNPFSDPNYAECLKNEFGEERYKQLQNEQPTSEEEKRMGKCMGPPGQGPQGQGPQGQGPQGQGPQGQELSPEEKIKKAIGIIQEATQEVLECISFNFGGDTYTKIVEEQDPDDYEAGVVIGCKENPIEVGETASEPANENNPGGQEGSSNSAYDLNIYSYTPSYTNASPNGNTSFGLNESADILLSGFGIFVKQ